MRPKILIASSQLAVAVAVGVSLSSPARSQLVGTVDWASVLSQVQGDDGTGNLIVGDNELGNPNGDDRSGSHNIVGGCNNDATAFVATVSGGSNNLASGTASTVSGGFARTAPGTDHGVAGGLLQDD